jgi:ABC-type multidrug transport system permease subunit
LQFGDPIFGVKEPLYTEFVAPGILVMIVFFMALGLTAMAFVLERKQGLIYRSYVAGVKNVEVLICYMITQVVVMVVQIFLTLLVMLVAFKIPNRGSVMTIALICFIQGCCGMSFGKLFNQYLIIAIFTNS